MSVESLTPASILLVNGTGRIAGRVIDETLAHHPDIHIGGINARTQRDPFSSFGMGLISDEVYGQSGPVEDAHTVDVPRCVAGGNSFYGKGVNIALRNGHGLTIPFSASPIAIGIDWEQASAGFVKDEEIRVRDFSGPVGVIDASTMKTNNFATRNSELADPSFKGRHPGHHLRQLKNGFVIVSSPLNLPAGVDGYDKRVPTFIAGVNDDEASIVRAFEQGEFCVSASSCSTNAIATFLMTLRRAEVQLAPDGSYMHINHANTESDSALEAQTVRGGASGSQSEISRLFGMSDELAITCDRVPLQVGSGLRASLRVLGRWTASSFVAALQNAVTENNTRAHFGIETRVPVTSSYIRGDRRTVVMDAEATQVTHTQGSNVSTVTVPLWFDNEAGYAANTMRLFKEMADALR